MLGLGKATAITQRDIWEIGQALKVDPAVIDGIGLTESNGAGWFPNGQIKILPEPHVFHNELPVKLRSQAIKAGLATKSYNQTKSSGHYKRMTNGPGPRYALLEKMIALHEDAAYKSISVGSFQIMGFNHAACGFSSAKQMFDAFCESEATQLNAFVNFIKSKNGGIQALRSEDYDAVETLYNGGGQNGKYAKIMRDNVDKARNGRWANYHPSQDAKVPHKSTPVDELKWGDISPEVEAVQNRLALWGYDIRLDGKFGERTEEAVKQFQSTYNLPVTGRVDSATRVKLFENPNKVQQDKLEAIVKPIVVKETTTKLEPVVPQSARKPWWKSWSMGGVGTIISGWFTTLMADLEPWMKFSLLLIGIGIAGLIFWNRQKLFNDAKDIVNRVRELNDNAPTTVEIEDKNT